MPLKMQSDITNVVFVATLLTEKTKVHMSKKVGIRDHSGLIFPLERLFHRDAHQRWTLILYGSANQPLVRRIAAIALKLVFLATRMLPKAARMLPFHERYCTFMRCEYGHGFTLESVGSSQFLKSEILLYDERL